jgi:hypothetical protein
MFFFLLRKFFSAAEKKMDCERKNSHQRQYVYEGVPVD